MIASVATPVRVIVAINIIVIFNATIIITVKIIITIFILMGVIANLGLPKNANFAISQSQFWDRQAVPFSEPPNTKAPKTGQCSGPVFGGSLQGRKLPKKWSLFGPAAEIGNACSPPPETGEGFEEAGAGRCMMMDDDG